jgi:hypothetical protein
MNWKCVAGMDVACVIAKGIKAFTVFERMSVPMITDV